MALGVGGLPRGRIAEIYGPESSGKTTLALHVTAQAQKAGGLGAFIDAEHALDPHYASRYARSACVRVCAHPTCLILRARIQDWRQDRGAAREPA